MSKICPNCGKELGDAMNFCEACGAAQQAAPQEAAPQVTVPQPTEAAPKASFDFNKIMETVKAYAKEAKTFAISLINRCKADKVFMYKCLAIGGGALVALILLIALVSSGSGMTKPIDTLIDVTFKGKVAKIKDLAPAEYWDWYEDEYDADIDDVIDEAEDSFDDMMEYYEEQYGDNIRVTYKVDSKKELSKRKLEGIAEALADKYDLNEDKVTAGYELDVEMVVKGSEDEDDTDSEITVIKYNGKWYAVSWYKYNNEYSASFLTGM